MTQNQESKWIAVSDRIPELTEPFLMYNDDNVQEVAWENDHAIVIAYDPDPRIGIFKAKFDRRLRFSEISSSSINCCVNPTHWMPIPSPPKTK